MRRNLLVQISLTLIIFFTENVEVSGEESSIFLSCSSFTSCDTCYDSSPLCHWCSKPGDEDKFSCNLKGSFWNGCFSGASCEKSKKKFPMERCKRSQPEKFWVSPMLKHILFTTSSIWLLVTCLILCVSSKHHFEQRKNVRQKDEEINVQTFDETNYQSISTNEYKQNVDDKPVNESTYVRNEVEMPNISKKMTYSSNNKFYMNFITTSCITCLVVLAAIAFFPKPLKLNICTSQVDWLSLFESTISNFDIRNNEKNDSSFQVETNILMSIYNPNLYDVQVDFAHVWFRYEGILFGSFSVIPSEMLATSITDDLVSIKFEPENFQVVYDLVLDYYRKVELEMEVKVDLGITIPSLFNASFTFNFDHLNIHLLKNEVKDAFADQDKELCQCK